MDWKCYEKEITDQFQASYPASKITPGAKLIGKFSKVERQIDLLVEEQASDFSFRIVIDAKYRGRKIDVGEVEAFLGLIRDVEAHTGVMVALEGYTPAAVNRAHYDDLDVILDVLNLDELKMFQGFGAVPDHGEHGVALPSPFGWIIDATVREGGVAWLYQRGLTFEEASGRWEFMYVNFWSKKDEKVPDLDALLKHQEAYIRESFPEAEISYLDGVQGQKTGARTLIRQMKNKKYPVPEYTGFIDFDEFILMCVLFTPEELERKNLRKLRQVLRQTLPMSVRHEKAITSTDAPTGTREH
jgi:Restriction endonuclease